MRTLFRRLVVKLVEKVKDEGKQPRPFKAEPCFSGLICRFITLGRCSPGLSQLNSLIKLLVSLLIARYVVPYRDRYQRSTLFPHYSRIK